MPTLVEESSVQAKALRSHDRASLAEELLQSLDGDSETDTNTDTDAAWEREIERRVAEIDAGAVKLISAEAVHAKARRLIKRQGATPTQGNTCHHHGPANTSQPHPPRP
jgi:putative addiction module component (TIGR02574 family)